MNTSNGAAGWPLDGNHVLICQQSEIEKVHLQPAYLEQRRWHTLTKLLKDHATHSSKYRSQSEVFHSIVGFQLFNMDVLCLQWHPERAQRGQGEAEAPAEEPASLLRRTEEGADGSPSMDQEGRSTQGGWHQGGVAVSFFSYVCQSWTLKHFSPLCFMSDTKWQMWFCYIHPLHFSPSLLAVRHLGVFLLQRHHRGRHSRGSGEWAGPEHGWDGDGGHRLPVSAQRGIYQRWRCFLPPCFSRP